MAQDHTQSSGAALAIQRVNAQQPGRLRLASPAVDPDGRIAGVYSAYEDGTSPPLSWTGMPDAEAFALVVEDPDAPMDKPVVHWIVWNIPGVLEGLPGGIGEAPVLHDLGGAVQGRNTHGRHGWMGPRPPVGDAPHHYHFQLFALDRPLDLKPDASLEELVERLKGGAIADAELVGTYARPDALDAPAHAPRTFEANEGRLGLDEDDVDKHAPHDAEGVVRGRGA